MTRKEHIEHHLRLHKALDELVADYIAHTKMLPSNSTVIDLIRWSFEQTEDPTDY